MAQITTQDRFPTKKIWESTNSIISTLCIYKTINNESKFKAFLGRAPVRSIPVLSLDALIYIYIYVFIKISIYSH